MNKAMVAQGLPPSLILPNALVDKRCPKTWRPDGNPSAPSKIQMLTASCLHAKINPSLSILTSAAVALSLLYTPSSSLAIPYPISSSSSPLTSSTPYSQAQNQQFGLEDGKIRPCPSTNPGCISTNPKSSSFDFPWFIPQTDTEAPLQKLEDAIRETQGNPKIRARESTPYDGTEFSGLATGSEQQIVLSQLPSPVTLPLDILSQPVGPTTSLTECPLTEKHNRVVERQYLQVEVDGGLGRDVLEFLVKEDVVAYRCMASKVTYIYPFTTAFGDSKGQQERLQKISDVLGWHGPDFEIMD